MKYIILVGDGMADMPIPELDGATPLERAATPNMDAIARMGRVGRVATIPNGLPPGSDVANMSLMGYDPAIYYTGRAPIEAAGMGVKLGRHDTAFRCNLVNIGDNRMRDYSSGAIETADAHTIIQELRQALQSEAVRLYPGVSYRHLLTITDFPDGALHCTPPHDITDQQIEPYLPRGVGSELLAELSAKANVLLAQTSVNRRRIREGRTPVTDIWLWGQGRAKVFPTLQERFGLRGSVISAVDLVRGLGTLAGLTVRKVQGATGYLDTNYGGKVAAALEALDTEDFVFVHVEAPDETSHEGSLSKKLQAIADFDCRVVGPVLAAAQRMDAWRLLVLPDHATCLSTKTHHAMPVPFTVAGTGIGHGTASTYCEVSVAGALPLHTGVTLFETFIRGTFG
jgi:2,3-bisphosphoglycerate-independent phosphoglycerate mutase